MKPERGGLMAPSPLVNAGTVLALTFALAACGGSEPVEKSDGGAPIRQDLTATWNSAPLEKVVADIALSEGPRTVIALAYEGAGVQIFSIDGAPIGREADLKLKSIARGQTQFFDESILAVFPALDQAGGIKILASAEELIAPIALDLDVGASSAISGICGGSPGGADGSVLRLGYWNATTPTALTYGEVTTDDSGELNWVSAGVLTAPDDITACSFDTAGPVVAAGPLILTADEVELERSEFDGRFRLPAPATALDVLSREGAETVYVARIDTGNIVTVREAGNGATMLLRSGLSVEAPEEPEQMAAIAAPRDGGYPYGVIAITGELTDGSNRFVFIDTQTLFDPVN